MIDQNKKEIVLKSLLFMIFRLLAVILAYLFVLTVIKLYGEDTYGYVTLGFAFMTVSSVITTLGFDLSLTKYFSQDDGIAKHSSKYYTALLISIVFSCLLGLVYYYFSDFIAIQIFNKPEFSMYLKWTAVSIPVWTLLILTASVFWGLKRIVYYSIFNTFGRFLLALSIIFVIYFGFTQVDNNTTPMIAHFIGLLILLIISVLILSRKIQRPSIKINNDFKGFFKNSSSILISSILIISLIWLDKIFLGIFVEANEIGYYDVGARIATLIVFSLEATNSILTPKIANSFAKNDLKQLQGDVNFISKINLIISTFIFIVLLVFNKSLFNFFGENYNTAKYVLIILCSAQLVNSFTGPVWNIMQMTGLQSLLSKILGVTLALNIILNVFLIKKYGINGAAIATGIASIFWNTVACYYVYKRLGIRTFYIPKFFTKNQIKFN